MSFSASCVYWYNILFIPVNGSWDPKDDWAIACWNTYIKIEEDKNVLIEGGGGMFLIGQTPTIKIGLSVFCIALFMVPEVHCFLIDNYKSQIPTTILLFFSFHFIPSFTFNKNREHFVI